MIAEDYYFLQIIKKFYGGTLQMAEIWTMGEVLVEIMRPEIDQNFYDPAEFLGPYPSGAPAIFIDTAARLGHSTGIISKVGPDDFGRCIIDRLRSHDVYCDLIGVDDELATAVAFNTNFSDGGRQFIYHLSPVIKTKAPSAIPGGAPKYFHLMGTAVSYDENITKEVLKTVDLFLKNGAKLSLDPNIRPEMLRSRVASAVLKPIIDNCSVLFPGEEELQIIAQEQDLDLAVKKMFENEKLEILALKRGSRGCTVYSRDEAPFDFGVYKISPVDPTGAGDSFDAGFICSLLEGKPLLECAKVASAAAALNTSAFGPMEGNISIETVRDMIQSNPTTN